MTISETGTVSQFVALSMTVVKAPPRQHRARLIGFRWRQRRELSSMRILADPPVDSK
jgi:hypothetical protein